MKYHVLYCFLRASCSYTNHYGSWLSQQVQRGKIRGDSPGTHKVSDDIIAMSSFNYQIFSCEICAFLNCLMSRRDTSVTRLKPMWWACKFISCKPEAPASVSWAVRWLMIMTFQAIRGFVLSLRIQQRAQHAERPILPQQKVLFPTMCSLPTSHSSQQAKLMGTQKLQDHEPRVIWWSYWSKTSW